MTGFADRLFEAVQAKESAVLLGIDPDPRRIPLKLFPRPGRSKDARECLAEGVRSFAEGMVTSVADVVVAIKPQLAYFERLGPPGLAAYEGIVACARGQGLLVITDGKRNDIAATAMQYAAAYLGSTPERAVAPGVTGPAPLDDRPAPASMVEQSDGEGPKADALTINAYMGRDSIEPFLGRVRAGKGLFVVVKTSNPSSGDLQDLRTAEKSSVAEVVGGWVEGWSRADVGRFGYGSVGAVVGATYPDELGILRRAMPHVPFLIPGFGAQGGGATDVAVGFDDRGLGAVVNASRSILYAYEREDLPFAEAARRAAIRMRDALRRAAPIL